MLRGNVAAILRVVLVGLAEGYRADEDAVPTDEVANVGASAGSTRARLGP